MARKVLRFYRGARRHPKWDMGTPPDRSRRGRAGRSGAGVARYGKWLIFGLVGLVVAIAVAGGA